MSAVYLKIETNRLMKLRSKKHVRLQKIEGYRGVSLFMQKEKATLRQQIRWIDAVIASRHYQLPLPL